MPANLTPQYLEAEKRFREAKSVPEKMAALEEMLAVMPKHKGTDHLRAELRRRLAKLEESAGKKLATARASLIIPKEGAAQVLVIGPPNTGKSQLVAAVTKAAPLVADYPFTTKEPTPGMMPFENIQVQLVDTPPISPGSAEWWLLNMLRRADALLLLLLVDLTADPVAQAESVLTELQNKGIEVRQKKVLIVGNKLDLPGAPEGFQALKERYGKERAVIAVSAKNGTGLEDMKSHLFRVLDIIRVYTKAPNQKPDLTEPVALPRGSTLADAAASVHKDFASRLKFARIWGSGQHDGMMVKRDHVLEDGDIIELHL